MNILKDILSIALATLLFFIAIEFSTRLLAPQTVQTELLEGGPLGLEDPVLGHVNRPNVRARVRAPEYDVNYVQDSRGFRSSGLSEQGEAYGDAKRILLIGDSFTFGAANHYEDIWPAKLAARLQDLGTGVQIFNAGVQGFDTSQQALYLERLYDEIRPDIVIAMFLPNDAFANEPIKHVNGEEVAKGDARAVTRAAGSKKSSLHTVLLLKRLLMNVDGLYTNLYKMTPRRDFFVRPPTELVARKINTTVSLFRRIQAFCDSKNIELMVVSVPQLFQVLEFKNGSEHAGDVDASLLDTEISAQLEKDGVNWVDTLDGLATRYETEGVDLYHRYDGHLNASGNDVMAGQILESLLPLLER